MKNSLVTIFLVLLSVGIFYLYIEPTYQKTQTLTVEKNEYSDALKKAQEVASKRDELLTKYNSISKEDMTRLDHILPVNLNSVKLVADINSVAGKHGITIRNIGVTEPVSDTAQEVVSTENKKAYFTTTIHFLFDATYSDLKSFLTDLENSLQLIDVQSIRISKVNDTGSPYGYDVSIQTYWIK